MTTRRTNRSTMKMDSHEHDNNNIIMSSDDSDASSDIDEPATHSFEGKTYDTYQEMVTAKRKRNNDWMEQSGLLKASSELSAKSKAVPRGLVRKKKQTVAPTTKRRKSSRLAGVVADGLYVEDERGGKFTITVLGGGAIGGAAFETAGIDQREAFYNNRINDGSNLSIQEAVELCGEKWTDETSATKAASFCESHVRACASSDSVRSPTSVVAEESLEPQKLETLSMDNKTRVAKVTPERIYSVACHPSRDALIVGAGDKLGHVGLWHVDDDSPTDGNFYLFRPHTRPVCCMQWMASGSGLLTASYDGSVRWFDAESQKFSQIFATYDSSACFKQDLGYGLEEGSRSWVQYCTGDFRSNEGKCFFLSTSHGKVLHVDMRTKGSLTFHEELSEKKINTVSLHPNGHSLATAGLDCTVKIWDLRRFGDSRTTRKKVSPLAEYHAGKSINSAFFSPASGTHLLLTTMADKLELFTNSHQGTGTLTPTKRIAHNNHTGRWLSTFMAKWHDTLDVFVVGSMQKPRSIEIFNSHGKVERLLQGENVSAISSRCCFHPSSERIIAVGGNSSGRVCVAG